MPLLRVDGSRRSAWEGLRLRLRAFGDDRVGAPWSQRAATIAFASGVRQSVAPREVGKTTARARRRER